MSQALYVIAGGLIGILSTIITDILRTRREQSSRRSESLREVSANFTSQISRTRRYSLTIRHERRAEEFWPLWDAAFTEARSCYELLLITAESISVQRAARHVLHYAFWLGQAARSDERGSFKKCHDELAGWSANLSAEVRRELGLKNPDDVYIDPPGEFSNPADGSPG